MSCPSCARGQTSNAALLQRVVLRKHRGTAVCRPSQTVEKPLWGGLEGRSPPNTIRTRRHVRRVRKPCAARFPCTFPRPRPRAQGKRVLAEKAGSAGLFRQAERDGCMPSLKKILISPLHSAARCGQPARRGPGSGAQRLFSARRGGPGAARRQTPGVRSSPGGYGPASFPRLWMFPRRLRRRGTHFRPSSPTQPLRRCAARQPR